MKGGQYSVDDSSGPLRLDDAVVIGITLGMAGECVNVLDSTFAPYTCV